MNVIRWFSTNWPFSPSLAAAAQLLCIFNECVSCYFWPGRSPHKLSHSTVFPFSLSLCVSVCVQMWLMRKVAKKKKSVHMYLSCSCACCSMWVCPLQLIYDTACTNACLRALDKMWTTCMCVWRREREGGRQGVCVYMCVKQMSCVPFCSTDWLVFVAAPSCRRAWPRASLSARTSHASTALICQLQGPSPAPNNTHSLTGPASSLDDAFLLTHTYHAPFFSLHSRTPALCRQCHANTRYRIEQHPAVLVSPFKHPFFLFPLLFKIHYSCDFLP